MRLFYALTLGPSQKHQMAGWQDAMEPLFGRSRRTEKDNVHLTLRFLGDMDDAQLDTLEEVLGRTAAETPPLGFTLDRADRFEKRRGNIWFAGMSRAPEELLRLKDRLDHWLEWGGFGAEPVPFTPHVTLFRSVREEAGEESIRQAVAGRTVEVCCRELVLMESRSGPQGVRYVPWRTAALDGRAAQPQKGRCRNEHSDCTG